jgi:hypothetical protein
MDGLATFAAIRERHPELSVLFLTGFKDERLPALVVGHPDVRVILKPFTSDLLKDKIARMA